jgi:uncharacterized membrane protein YtjA (UPF0391 family)
MLYALLLRLALAMRDVGVFAGGLRVALRFRRFFVTLGVFALAMMFGGSPMALSGVFVMFRRLGMSFLRHSIFPLFECRYRVNSLSLVIVPAPAPDPSANTLLRARRAAGPLEHKQRERVGGPVNPGSAKRNLMLGWAIAFFIVALIAGGLGFGIVSGTAFAAAKIIFVLALLAFLISAVVEVARRGAP